MNLENNHSIDPKYETKNNEKIPDWIINEALLINDALDKGVVNKVQAQADRGEIGAIFENKEILGVMEGLVQPCFFVEYPPENLKGRDRGEILLELFKSKFQDKDGKEWELSDYLAQKRQGVSVCMSSLDNTTAESFRYLNKKGVPITAWVVVDDAEGYWTNATNVAQTALKTQEILDWAKAYDVKLQAFGFDAEAPLEILAATAKENIVQVAKRLISYKKSTFGNRSQKDFANLVASLKEQDVTTEVYAFPNVLKGVLGGVNFDGSGIDRVVEMAYTGDFPENLQKFAFKLMHSKNNIPALGIVSGDETETPGRDFSRITQANAEGIDLVDAQKGALPKHLSEESVSILINEWLNQVINLDNRTFSIREIYLFALNNAHVALIMSRALEEAFKKQEQKYQ